MGVAIELPEIPSVVPRETAGAKIQKFLASRTGEQYEAGEILIPIFKDLEKVILKIRDENKSIPEYYIVTHSQKNPMLGGALHIRTFWRKTRPTPGYNFDCYKVTNPGDHFQFCWTIPSEAICRAILAAPQNYDPQLARCVVEFAEGSLV